MLILLSLSGIVWIALALRELNVVTSEGQSALMLFKITTLALPNLMAIIAPVALLVASVHTLNRLNGDSELIVLTASGASIWVVALPLLTLALLVSMAVSFVNHFAMPWSLKELRQSVLQMRTDLLTQVMQPGRFSSPEKGLTLHIRDRTTDGVLLGLLIEDGRRKVRKNRGTQSYLAERAIIVKQDDQALLVMFDGHVLSKGKPDEAAKILAFEKYAIDLHGFESGGTGRNDIRPRESYYGELVNPDPESVTYKVNPGQFVSELHERFANPLYPFVFVLLAVAFVGQAQSTRQNRIERVTGAFLSAVAIRLTGLAANNFVTITPSLFLLLYAVPLVAIAVSVGWMVFGRVPRGGPTVLERAITSVMEVGRALTRRWLGPSQPAGGR